MSAKTQRRPWPEVKREEMAKYPEVFAELAAHFESIRSGGPPHIHRPFITVATPEDMPTFANEDEEREFWDVHEMGDAWFDVADPILDEELPPPRPRSRRSQAIRDR